MNRKLLMIAAAVMAATTIVASAAGLQDDSSMRRRLSTMAIRRIEHRLNITDAQRTSVRNILKAEEPAIRSLAQRVHSQNEQLASQPFDEARVRSFAKENERTSEDRLVEREKIRAEVMQVLSPAQQQKLAQLRAERSSDLIDHFAFLVDQI